MSYFFDLEERLRMLELEVKQQRYDFESPHDKLHKLKEQLGQLEDKVTEVVAKGREYQRAFWVKPFGQKTKIKLKLLVRTSEKQ